MLNKYKEYIKKDLEDWLGFFFNKEFIEILKKEEKKYATNYMKEKIYTLISPEIYFIFITQDPRFKEYVNLSENEKKDFSVFFIKQLNLIKKQCDQILKNKNLLPQNFNFEKLKESSLPLNLLNKNKIFIKDLYLYNFKDIDYDFSVSFLKNYFFEKSLTMNNEFSWKQWLLLNIYVFNYKKYILNNYTFFIKNNKVLNENEKKDKINKVINKLNILKNINLAEYDNNGNCLVEIFRQEYFSIQNCFENTDFSKIDKLLLRKLTNIRQGIYSFSIISEELIVDYFTEVENLLFDFNKYFEKNEFEKIQKYILEQKINIKNVIKNLSIKGESKIIDNLENKFPKYKFKVKDEKVFNFEYKIKDIKMLNIKITLTNDFLKNIGITKKLLNEYTRKEDDYDDFFKESKKGLFIFVINKEVNDEVYKRGDLIGSIFEEIFINNIKNFKSINFKSKKKINFLPSYHEASKVFREKTLLEKLNMKEELVRKKI